MWSWLKGAVEDALAGAGGGGTVRALQICRRVVIWWEVGESDSDSIASWVVGIVERFERTECFESLTAVEYWLEVVPFVYEELAVYPGGVLVGLPFWSSGLRVACLQKWAIYEETLSGLTEDALCE